MREVLPTLGDLSGKIVIDTTNRFGRSPEDGDSAAQDIAKLLPGAKVVKAFNTMGWETLINPVFSGEKATVFLAGDDSAAKNVVAGLATEIGLDTVDTGPLANAGMIEKMSELWVTMMRSGHGRDFAFRLIQR